MTFTGKFALPLTISNTQELTAPKHMSRLKPGINRVSLRRAYK